MQNEKHDSSETDVLAVRRMARAELDWDVEWAAAEGWNPGLQDANCFYAADPEGFFIALLDGKPAGSISAVRYGQHFGFIGLFIVSPEHRGGLLGIRLGKAALDHLQGRNIGLDGVLAGYGVIRKCRAGYKIGHLFADSLEIAENLLNALTLRSAGSAYYLDVPEPNGAALPLVRNRKMKEVFSTARMYSAEIPALPLDKIFGITTFELG